MKRNSIPAEFKNRYKIIEISDGAVYQNVVYDAYVTLAKENEIYSIHDTDLEIANNYFEGDEIELILIPQDYDFSFKKKNASYRRVESSWIIEFKDKERRHIIMTSQGYFLIRGFGVNRILLYLAKRKWIDLFVVFHVCFFPDFIEK